MGRIVWKVKIVEIVRIVWNVMIVRIVGIVWHVKIVRMVVTAGKPGSWVDPPIRTG